MSATEFFEKACVRGAQDVDDFRKPVPLAERASDLDNHPMIADDLLLKLMWNFNDVSIA